MKLLLFLGLLSLNAQSLQLLQPTYEQNTVKKQLGKVEQILSSTQILTQLKKNATSGDAIAQLSLAKMYHRGISVARDAKLAFYWYTQAAEAGYASAQFNLAELYYNGIGTEKNFKQALFWYAKAAQQNFVDAQYKLASMYHHGSGVEFDYEQAHYWYEKAAKLQFVPAQLELAKLYDQGKGVEKNYILAQVWYEAAALHSNAEAQYYLASLLERQNKFFQALLMYQQSAKQEFAKAQLRLAEIYHQGYLSEKDDIAALKLALAVATKGNKEAQFLVARIYHTSAQVTQDLSKAKYWYYQAFKKGHTLAQFFLSQLDAYVPNVTENQIAKTFGELEEKISDNSTTKQIITMPDAEAIRHSLAENTKATNESIKKLNLDAEQGDPTAQYNLSLVLSDGMLAPKDEKRAFLLMQKSAKQGLAQSKNSLAIMYLKGIGVKSNYQMAVFWANSSAEQGNQSGKDILSYITKYNDSTQNH